MASSILTFTLLSTSLLAATSTAQQTPPPTILSCADVNCPTDPGPTTNNICTLGNTTYSDVGVVKVPVTPLFGSDLTWVEAITVIDSKANRTFIKDFYLASDPGSDLSDGNTVGACALFFTKINDGVGFRGDEKIGTCANALSERCVEKMVQTAEAAEISGMEGAEACDALQKAFEGKVVDDECLHVAGGTWTGVEVKALTGPGAPSPITPEQNSTSNCWPVSPNSYSLISVMRISTTGDYYLSTGIRNLLNIVPVLTVFYPRGNGSSIAALKPEAQLACLKAIEESVESNLTMKSNGAAKLDTGVSMSAVLAGALAVYWNF
ncbi:hypothetical protein B0T16DRAFT_458637 [Cercophora newfieldiana]|uniref:Uncharacterized protein n=1 Tax=Cercophora newfieldiana TaxID=92897 RepID=A0AA39Y8B4_9PEZI|nr:hypothetical protein B0T16DRAFT_458637 [Cercophora newfieldiana]